MTFWIVVAAVMVVGAALAWWTSGRARHRPADPQSTADGVEAEAQTMRQYRPTGGIGPTLGGG